LSQSYIFKFFIAMPACETQNCRYKMKLSHSKGSWLSLLLIAILPKCPFCVMAYSGAVTLCSGKMYPNAHTESVYFLLILGLVITVSILLNYRGRRTLVSLSLVLIGVASMMLSQVVWYSEVGYYYSVLLIFIAIWNNGSLHYLINKFSNHYSVTFKYK